MCRTKSQRSASSARSLRRRYTFCINNDGFYIKDDESDIQNYEFCIKDDGFYIQKYGFYIPNDEFCIENDGLCIPNGGFYIPNDESCIKMMNFALKMMDFAFKMIYFTFKMMTLGRLRLACTSSCSQNGSGRISQNCQRCVFRPFFDRFTRRFFNHFSD